LTVRRLFLLFLSLPLAGCYTVRQALHQNDLFNSRRPVDEVVTDQTTSAKTREGLAEVKDVLHYAAVKGLNVEGAYGYYIDSGQPVVSYTVQAAYSDRLQFVTWWFPVIGRVPYLGFFEKSERDAKAAALRADGYDVAEGAAGAFSSLGWFDDPIFSSMLNRDQAALAHLFFHELTHRTLWVPGSTEFNENLAEYVATVMTEQYLKDLGRPAQLAKYEARRRDRARLFTWLKGLKGALTTLYAQAGQITPSVLLARKQAVYARYTRAPLKPTFERTDLVATETWNNASVLGEELYMPDFARFARARRCLGDAPVRAFLDELGRRSKTADSGFAALDSMCDGQKAYSRVD